MVARRDSLLVVVGDGLVMRRRKPLPGNGWVKEEDGYGERRRKEEKRQEGGGGRRSTK